MTDEDILKILKIDLQISVDTYDDYLRNMICLAKEAISDEGIQLMESERDGMLVEIYAAYLYRKRKTEKRRCQGCSAICLTIDCFGRKQEVDDGRSGVFDI